MSVFEVTESDFEFILKGRGDITFSFNAETRLISWDDTAGHPQHTTYTLEQVRSHVSSGSWEIQVPNIPEIIEPEEEDNYIVSNQIECLKCGDKPFSATVHDFKYCKCQSVAVDGGQEYLKRVGKRENWRDLSIVMPRKALFTIVNEVELAATSGRNNFGIALAALRGIRDAGLRLEVSDRGFSGYTVAKRND